MSHFIELCYDVGLLIERHRFDCSGLFHIAAHGVSVQECAKSWVPWGQETHRWGESARRGMGPLMWHLDSLEEALYMFMPGGNSWHFWSWRSSGLLGEVQLHSQAHLPGGDPLSPGSRRPLSSNPPALSPCRIPFSTFLLWSSVYRAGIVRERRVGLLI